jgi:hypothetical protein
MIVLGPIALGLWLAPSASLEKQSVEQSLSLIRDVRPPAPRLPSEDIRSQLRPFLAISSRPVEGATRPRDGIVDRALAAPAN